MNSTGIGEKCAPALFLFAVRGFLTGSSILAHECMPSFCLNTLLNCDIMLTLLQVFWTEQTTHINYLYIRAMEQHVGHCLSVEHYALWTCITVCYHSSQKRAGSLYLGVQLHPMIQM